MPVNAPMPLAPRSQPELVIALHCSGSSAAQWRSLEPTLGENFAFAAPEHYGSGNSPPWTGGDTFTAADEARRTLALIDGADRKIHLIGHSYGGGVAMHIALARSERIASLTLYEPSAFYLLKQVADGAAPFAESNQLRTRSPPEFAPETGAMPPRALSSTGADRVRGT